MLKLRSLTHAAVLLACVGLVVPRGAFAAGPATPPASNDVALSGNGTLSGVVVTSEGQPLDGAVVTVLQGERVVGRTTSNAHGVFALGGLSNGVYQVGVGQQVSTIRAWSASVAPPSARAQALVVVGNATRAQGELLGLDIITLWTLTASTGALILAAINQSDLNDLNDKVDTLISP